MWNDLKQRSSHGNTSWVQQIKADLSTLRQEGLTVAEYYTRMKALWDELDD
ncbi:hypothetical protein CDL15_Pgr015034 [Punica granatum]|uniref:Retrotransposon gag domain-containing protein n=1 Tax=Punica granatum TaxID=22663 RepID=A0A218WZ82_PUNGR|nr:hypothetical protein CDL15_Pgr015034 [Punica granatum]